MGVDPGPDPGLALAIATPKPNPAVASDLKVHFTLPTGAPAMLELFDVRGRRLTARDVGGLGAGSHAVTLVQMASRAPGVGFLRLTQGPRTRSTHVVLID